MSSPSPGVGGAGGTGGGPLLVGIGAALMVTGLLIWSGALRWFGRLPGDVRIERETTRVYMPFTSMLVVSAVVSLIVQIIRRLR